MYLSWSSDMFRWCVLWDNDMAHYYNYDLNWNSETYWLELIKCFLKKLHTPSLKAFIWRIHHLRHHNHQPVSNVSSDFGNTLININYHAIWYDDIIRYCRMPSKISFNSLTFMCDSVYCIIQDVNMIHWNTNWNGKQCTVIYDVVFCCYNIEQFTIM